MSYEMPKMLIYTFEEEDVITVSTLDNGGTGGQEGGNVGDIFNPQQPTLDNGGTGGQEGGNVGDIFNPQ